MSVDVDLRNGALEIYYNRELRVRYDFETGEQLPLDDVGVAVPAAAGRGARLDVSAPASAAPAEAHPRGRGRSTSRSRMCVACREHDAKRALVRIVRTTEGTVEIDPTGRRNGRGAYLCHQPACWERAIRTGRWPAP